MYISVSCCKVFVWVHEIIYLLVIFLKAIRLFSSDSLLVPVKQSSIKGLGYRYYDRKAVQKEQEGKKRENGTRKERSQRKGPAAGSRDSSFEMEGPLRSIRNSSWGHLLKDRRLAHGSISTYSSLLEDCSQGC